MPRKQFFPSEYTIILYGFSTRIKENIGAVSIPIYMYTRISVRMGRREHGSVETKMTTYSNSSNTCYFSVMTTYIWNHSTSNVCNTALQ